jgi:membrane protease YdiL (CAAX protease family)
VKTSIGQQLSGSPWRIAAAGIIGAVTVAVDLLLVHVRMAEVLIDPRWLLTLVPLAAYLLLARGDRRSIGLNLAPLQGWGYWCRITLILGLLTGGLVGGLVVIAWGVYRLLGMDLPVYATPPHRVADAFVGMCVTAPLLEESIYRIAVCVPAAVLLRPAGAIAVSGLLFGLLHVLAGNPGPDNLIAGFFLAWAFVKSGSIMVPLVWHSLGNLCALAIQVGTWYWLGRPGS